MPVSTFGLTLRVINDTYCKLPVANFRKKNFYHLATVIGGTQEYVAYLHPKSNKVWIERVASGNPVTLEKIQDDQEWSDVRDFMFEANLLEIGSRKEVPISEEVAKQMSIINKPKFVEI
jgi:hypothetical protein